MGDNPGLGPSMTTSAFLDSFPFADHPAKDSRLDQQNRNPILKLKHRRNHPG
jgi:hypothetical protein